MTQEELEKMVRETHELSRMNYKMIKSMRTQARWALVFKLLYSGVIVAVLYFSYTAIKPTLDTLQNTYLNLSQTVGQFQGEKQDTENTSNALNGLNLESLNLFGN